MLIGEYIHTFDEKKRISLPSRFRKEIGKRVVVTRGLDNCLFLYPLKEWQKISGKLSELGINKKLAHICAKLAELPKEEYEQVRDGIVSMAKALNNAKLKTRKSDAEIEAAKSRGHKQVGVFVYDLNSLPLKESGCIYVDPPWKYLHQGTRGLS